MTLTDGNKSVKAWLLREMKAMLQLWKREWKWSRRSLFAQLGILLVASLTVFLIYITSKLSLFKFTRLILKLPKELYVLIGLTDNMSLGNFMHYMYYVVMILNLLVAWKVCTRLINGVAREESSGCIFTICNQWYGREQIFMSKYLWTIVTTLGMYLLWYVSDVVFIQLGAFNQEQKAAGMSGLLMLMIKSCFVVIMLSSVSLCKSMKNKSNNAGSTVMTIMAGSLILGNIYKLWDIIGLIMELLKSPIKSGGIFDLLGYLVWISPLSWINPYVEFSALQTTAQICICVIVSSASVYIGLRRYKKRSFAM